MQDISFGTNCKQMSNVQTACGGANGFVLASLLGKGEKKGNESKTKAQHFVTSGRSYWLPGRRGDLLRWVFLASEASCVGRSQANSWGLARRRLAGPPCAH